MRKELNFLGTTMAYLHPLKKVQHLEIDNQPNLPLLGGLLHYHNQFKEVKPIVKRKRASGVMNN